MGRPRSSPGASRSPQGLPRRARKRAKSGQERAKTAKTAPRSPLGPHQIATRRFKVALRNPKSGQEASWNALGAVWRPLGTLLEPSGRPPRAVLRPLAPTGRPPDLPKRVFNALVRVPALFLTSDLARQAKRGSDAACKKKSPQRSGSPGPCQVRVTQPPFRERLGRPGT